MTRADGMVAVRETSRVEAAAAAALYLFLVVRLVEVVDDLPQVHGGERDGGRLICGRRPHRRRAHIRNTTLLRHSLYVRHTRSSSLVEKHYVLTNTATGKPFIDERPTAHRIKRNVSS